MKKLLAVLLAVLMLTAFAACGETAKTDVTEEATTAAQTVENGTIRLATTTSVNDSGLLGYLLPYFEKASGYKVEVASAGTGVAIGYAKSGDADLLLVHSKSQEEEFIEAGFASTERLSFMYNYFVIAGPADDPAGIKDAETAADAFKKIADAKAPFASRGDNSGTHNKETGIWEAAAIDPSAEAWYSSLGSGMGDTLTPLISGMAELFMRVTTVILLPKLIGRDGVYFAEAAAWTGAEIILMTVYCARIRRETESAKPEELADE